MISRVACQTNRIASRTIARRISTSSSSSFLSTEGRLSPNGYSAAPSNLISRINVHHRHCQTRCFSSNSAEIIDYFELFGLPSNNFSIDQSQMKQSYLKLMNEHHPDKQQQRPTSDDNLLTAETITHAYQILKSPHTRALHWLELQGYPLGEDSGKSNDDDISFTNQQDLVGMEFLMEIMEWREAIEDAGSDQAKLEAIGAETQVLQQSCEQALADLIDGTPMESDPATVQDARQLTAQLQYWQRLEKTLKEQLEVV